MPGWQKLIAQLCEDVQAFLDEHEDYRKEFYVTSVKETRGWLAFYAFPERDEIEALVEAAVTEAAVICERCGEPGKLGIEDREGFGEYWSVKCESCRPGDETKQQ